MKANKNSKEYASKTVSLRWELINWYLMEEQVRTLQARIVKAQQAGKHRKVRSLQWILTNSFAAKVLAVKRVTSNSGKNTPGVDGVKWSTEVSKMNAVQSLQRKGYKPLPLRRVYIPKSNGKLRPLSIPCMKDRAMQALHLMAVDPVGETVADRYSFGFRPKRSCADAIEQCFNVLAKRVAARWILDADIKGCFDNISHEWLIKNIPLDKRLLRLWLKSKIIDGKTFINPEMGTPQGGIISPWLANMVLNGMENVLDIAAQRLRKADGCIRINKSKVNFVRYADDFIITSNDKRLLQDIIVPAIESFLQERGLSLSAEKTHIVHIRQGFDFLGQNVRKYKDKLLIKPSRKNVKAIRKKIKDVIVNNKTITQEKLILQLNPIIRGWATYHKHVVAKQTFVLLDNQIFKMLWYWARRRHQNKSQIWVKRKYFPLFRGIEWNFSCIDEYGQPLRLYKAQLMVIQRHLEIRGNANPYDLDWYDYFEKRKNPIRL